MFAETVDDQDCDFVGECIKRKGGMGHVLA